MKRRNLAYGIALGFLSFAPDALAVVGRPLTPMSYAGVARRTTRRAVVGTAVVAGAATTAYVATLPHGCVNYPYAGATYYHCGSVYYQPVYQDGNVVYVEAHPQ